MGQPRIDRIDAARIIETHVSILILIGDRAYKLKKPVQLPFVDLSTREARESICRREVRLNRRLAPDVYLGVADVVGPDDLPCDHLVVMKRMPDGRRLSDLLRTGEATDGCIDEIAETIAEFHARTSQSVLTDRQGTVEVQRQRWGSNRDEMRRFVGPILDERGYERVTHLAETYLAGRGALFEERIAAGRVRDCHGDMLADDVYCLEDGPRILDGLEFDDELRYIDVLDDVACLAMDIERAGGPAPAHRLTRRYLRATQDDAPGSLLHYFIAYRAFMWAKIACLRDAQGDLQAADHARQLMHLAEGHLIAGRVKMVIIGGLPGTGKTTLSRRLAAAYAWHLLRSDSIRKQLAGLMETARTAAGFGSGLYSRRITEKTYQTLLDGARRDLQLGHSVVLDASWSRQAHRAGARAMARETGADLVELRCVLDPIEAERRIRDRQRAGGDASDADVEVARRMSVDFEPWPEAALVDTSQSIRHLLEQATAKS